MAQSRRCWGEHAASQPSYDGIGKPPYWADAVSAMPIQIVGDRCESPVTLSSSRTAHAYVACGLLGLLEAAAAAADCPPRVRRRAAGSAARHAMPGWPGSLSESARQCPRKFVR